MDGTTPVSGGVPTLGGGEEAFQAAYDAGEQKKGEIQTQQAQPAEPEAPEAPAWADFDGFLTAHKADRDAVLNLPVGVKINGVDGKAPLAELIKSYQLEQHIQGKSQALAEERRAWETEQGAARTLVGEQVRQARLLAEGAQNLLNHDFQRVDWNALKAQDPARAALLMQEFQLRQAGVQQYLNGVAQQEQQKLAEQQQQAQKALSAEREKMLSARPEWRDPQKLSEVQNRITTLGRTLGFTDAELATLNDHRLLLMADMAASFAALQAKAPQAVQQVREAPKPARPGSRTGASPQDAARKSVIDRFRANPRDVDAQAAMFSLYE